LDSSTLVSRVGRAMAGMFAARGVSMALQFVAFAVLAGHLGPSLMGAFAFATSTVLIFQFASNAGFYGVVVREIAQHPEHEPQLVPSLFFLRAAVGAVAYGALLLFVTVGGFSAQQRGAAAIAGLLLILNALDAMRSVVEVRLKMSSIVLGSMLQAAFFTAGVVVLAHRQAGLYPYVWLWLGGNVIALSTVLAAGLRTTRLHWRPNFGQWVPLARKAAPFWFALVMGQVYGRFGIVLLAALKPSSDVGQYGVGAKLLDTLGVFPTLVMGVLTPVLARTFADSRELLGQRYRRSFHLLAVVALPVAVGGAMTAWRWLPALPGLHEYDGGGVVASILSVTAAAIFLAYLTQSMLMIGHQQRALIWIAAVGLGINVVVNLVLVTRFGYVGAAAASVATESSVFVWSAIYVKRTLGIGPVSRELVRVVWATVVMGLILAPGYLLPPFAQLGLGVATYVAAAVALRGVSMREVRALAGRGRPGSVSEPQGSPS